MCRVNLEVPTVTVQYEDCSVDATVHVGSRALPSVWNSYRDKFEVRLTSGGIRSSCKQLKLPSCPALLTKAARVQAQAGHAVIN